MVSFITQEPETKRTDDQMLWQCSPSPNKDNFNMMTQFTYKERVQQKKGIFVGLHY